MITLLGNTEVEDILLLPVSGSETAIGHNSMERSPIAALEPKQLDDEASRFHLGRQRQYSAVICSGALLFVVARFATS